MTWAEWVERLEMMSRSLVPELTRAEAADLRTAMLHGVAEGVRRGREDERRRLVERLRDEGHAGSVIGKLAASYDANGSEVQE